MTTIEDILAREDENRQAQQADSAKTNTPKGINQPIPIQTPQVTVPKLSTPSMQIPVITTDNSRQATSVRPVYPVMSDTDKEKINQGMNMLNWLDSVYKPKELDERRLANNRTIGTIGDSLKLLAQMYGAGKGAHIRENKPGSSLTDYFLGEENRLRDLYEKHNDQYKNLKYNTVLQEYARQQQLEERLRQEAEKANLEKVKHEYNLERDKIKNQYSIDNENLRYSNENNPESFKNNHATETLKETQRRNDATIAQGWVRANAAKQRAETSKGNADKDEINLKTSIAISDRPFMDYLIKKYPEYFNIQYKKDRKGKIDYNSDPASISLKKEYFPFIANLHEEYLKQNDNQQQQPTSVMQPNAYDWNRTMPSFKPTPQVTGSNQNTQNLWEGW